MWRFFFRLFIRIPPVLQVVDMAVVVDVISQLETLPITKEALEVRQVRNIVGFFCFSHVSHTHMHGFVT